MIERLRDARAEIDSTRIDSLDSGLTQIPKGTLNMVVDVISAAIDDLISAEINGPEVGERKTYVVTEETLAEAIRQAMSYSPEAIDGPEEWYASPREMARAALARLGLEEDAE